MNDVQASGENSFTAYMVVAAVSAAASAIIAYNALTTLRAFGQNEPMVHGLHS